MGFKIQYRKWFATEKTLDLDTGRRIKIAQEQSSKKENFFDSWKFSQNSWGCKVDPPM